MPKAPTKQDHWGRWIVERTQMLGFRRQQDVAKAIGVSRQHLAKWIAMDRPPRHFRKGLDVALARVLRVSPMILFCDWEASAAGNWPLNSERETHSLPWHKPAWEETTELGKVIVLMRLLDPDVLHQWIKLGTTIAEKDSRWEVMRRA